MKPRRVWLGFLGLLLAITAHAVEIVEVSPPVVAPGRNQELRITGKWLDDGQGRPTIWTSLGGEGRVLSVSREEIRWEWTPPVGAPLGPVAVRVIHSWGASAPFWIVLGNEPSLAAQGGASANKAVTLNSPGRVVCSLSENSRAWFRLAAQKGQRIAVESFAGRLGMDFDPVLAVWDSRGRELAHGDDDPFTGRDARLEFTAPTAGEFLLELSDARYRGGRCQLRLGDFPFACAAFPLAVEEPGRKEEALEWRGRGEETAMLLASQFPQRTEREPNDALDQAEAVPIPGGLSGRTRGGARDFFRLKIPPKIQLSVRPRTRSLGSDAILKLSLLDERGERLASTGEGDAFEETLRFRDERGGTRFLQVEDLVGQSDERPYHISIQDRVAPVEASLDEKEPAFPLAAPGGLILAKVNVVRFGYDGPIRFASDGCEIQGEIGDKAKGGEMLIRVPRDAQAGLRPLALLATVEIDGVPRFAPVSLAAQRKSRWPHLLPAPDWLDTQWTVTVVPAPLEIDGPAEAVSLPGASSGEVRFALRWRSDLPEGSSAKITLAGEAEGLSAKEIAVTPKDGSASLSITRDVKAKPGPRRPRARAEVSLIGAALLLESATFTIDLPGS